jgi:mercuric ion binding protein
MKKIHLTGPAMAVMFALTTTIPAAHADEPAAATASSSDQIEVHVNGMACPFCAYGIQKKLRALPGARDVRVDLEAGRATFEAPSGWVTESQVKQAIKDAGFSAGKIEIKHKR